MHRLNFPPTNSVEAVRLRPPQTSTKHSVLTFPGKFSLFIAAQIFTGPTYLAYRFPNWLTCIINKSMAVGQDLPKRETFEFRFLDVRAQVERTPDPSVENDFAPEASSRTESIRCGGSFTPISNVIVSAFRKLFLSVIGLFWSLSFFPAVR